MFQIRCNDKVIYDLRDEELLLISPELFTGTNKTGTVTFTIPPQNPMYSNIKLLRKGIITVYQDEEEIWRGRILNTKKDFFNRKFVECEGELAFLLDVKVRPYSFHGEPSDLFRNLIEEYNSKVEVEKQFVIRNVQILDNNNYIYRSSSTYPKVFDEIKEKLLDSLGGHLETGPTNDGKRWIDYVPEYKNINSQNIEFKENLLDITEYLKGEDIKTVVIPLGATDENGNKLTIASVNEGKDFIEDKDAISLFGRIEDVIEFNDVTQAENLLRKGQNELQKLIYENTIIEITAADLHYIDVDIQKFKVGDWVRVISLPHNLDKLFLITELKINLENPANSSITLSGTFQTFTQKNNRYNKKIQASINVTNSMAISASDSAKKAEAKVDNVIVELDTEYVLTENFEKYKIEVNQKLASVYTIKGSVASYEKLLLIEIKNIGDVYNVLDTGANYVYTADGWDKLSETYDLSGYLTEKNADKKYAMIISLDDYLKIEDAEKDFINLEDFNKLEARVKALEEKNESDSEEG